MKIIKENDYIIETWYSPKRFKELKHFFNSCFFSVMFNIKSSDYKKIYHNKNAPSLIQENYIAWYNKGKIHRIDGPSAIIRNFNMKHYCFNGKQISEEQYWNM